MKTASNSTPISQQALLKENDAAKILNLEVATLRRWRWCGVGPVFRKIGFAVRYHPDDIKAFVDNSARSSTSERSR